MTKNSDRKHSPAGGGDAMSESAAWPPPPWRQQPRRVPDAQILLRDAQERRRSESSLIRTPNQEYVR